MAWNNLIVPADLLAVALLMAIVTERKERCKDDGDDDDNNDDGHVDNVDAALVVKITRCIIFVLVVTMLCKPKVATDISYQTTVKHEDTPIKVDILDTSHQDECQPSCHDVYDADAFVVVYSITDTTTFKVAQDELGRIRSGTTANAPILLLGNKLDFEHVRKVCVLP
ncbi:hypothetical protein RRG08_017232 [Elysia crispata]|uniref:small monomeric GTPase n=1 Tax=Elysia crispata TaxID=231223 RepID=A0AAE1DAA2_9GAST|nr:hypothetical protein RRG08_017232 [Elysia crispata]